MDASLRKRKDISKILDLVGDDNADSLLEIVNSYPLEQRARAFDIVYRKITVYHEHDGFHDIKENRAVREAYLALRKQDLHNLNFADFAKTLTGERKVEELAVALNDFLYRFRYKDLGLPRLD
jgi:hypothetical protein